MFYTIIIIILVILIIYKGYKNYIQYKIVENNFIPIIYNDPGNFGKGDTIDLEQGDLKQGDTVDTKNCICVFDIDHTITCGNPQPFIDKCINQGCKLAINTARPVKYANDIDLDLLKFIDPHYNDSDFYYNPSSYSQTPEQVAEVKSGYLDLLKNKYTIKDKKCVVLLDDSDYNIKTASNYGYSVIKADNDNYIKKSLKCGLHINDLDDLEKMLNSC